MAEKMPSKQIFRKHSREEDDKQSFSVANTKETSVAISVLKTFSCEADAEPTGTFTKNWFALETDGQKENKQKICRKQEQDVIPIVTPHLPGQDVVEINLDPLPESEIHPLLLDIDCDERSSLPLPDSGLLFPLIDEELQIVIASTECKASIPEESCDVDDDDDHTAISDTIIQCNLRETYVYKHLRPLLPLPDSFGPILCLFLHLEFSSTISTTILTQACEIVNEQWHKEKERSSIAMDNKKGIQNISGKIVDELVEHLGPIVDLPILFQASAQTLNRLSPANEDEDGLSIFHQTDPNAPKTESQDGDDAEVGPCNLNGSIGEECTSGHKRKSRTNDDAEEEKLTSKKRVVFVPTMLQLAVAYGANHSKVDGISFGGKKPSLEEFVEKTTRRLQAMDSTERGQKWNDLVGLW